MSNIVPFITIYLFVGLCVFITICSFDKQVYSEFINKKNSSLHWFMIFLWPVIIFIFIADFVNILLIKFVKFLIGRKFKHDE